MKKLGLMAVLCLISGQVLAAVPEAPAKQAIQHFYHHYVFGGHDLVENADKVGTQKLLSKLQAAYLQEYDCDDQPCYGVWVFRTGAQDGSGASKVTKIQARGEDWYRVTYWDMGHSGVTEVKVVQTGGSIKIDDYKKISEKMKKAR